MPIPSLAARAGLVTRLTAFAIDAAILSLTLAIATWLLDVAAHAAHRFAPPINLPAVLLTCAPLLAIVYIVGFWRASGQTPGQWVMGLRVVALGGGRIGIVRCMLRLFGYLVSTVPLYLGFVWILGPLRRGWHDHLAGTEVVYVAAQPAAERSLRLEQTQK
jgi:uncharacterized RDD family membrane protein YckC